MAVVMSRAQLLDGRASSRPLQQTKLDLVRESDHRRWSSCIAGVVLVSTVLDRSSSVREVVESS